MANMAATQSRDARDESSRMKHRETGVAQAGWCGENEMRRGETSAPKRRTRENVGKCPIFLRVAWHRGGAHRRGEKLSAARGRPLPGHEMGKAIRGGKYLYHVELGVSVGSDSSPRAAAGEGSRREVSRWRVTHHPLLANKSK